MGRIAEHQRMDGKIHKAAQWELVEVVDHLMLISGDHDHPQARAIE